jgi:hypothetical protein
MRRQISANELHDLYYRLGRNIWHIQYLEDVLHTWLTLKVEVKTPGRITEVDARELLAKHRRATLGTALKTAESHGALTDETLEGLRHLKDERDWLVHRSMHQDGDSLYTDEGREAISSRLDAMLGTTIALKSQVVAEVTVFCTDHGMSEALANQLALQQISKLKGEA